MPPDTADVYLRETYIPEHNARFGKEAAETGTAFVPYKGAELDEVLCVRGDRIVGRDNCVSWAGKALQIPEQKHRRHYVKATVCVHEYPDGRLAVFDGPRCLARYNPAGVISDEPALTAA
jgi:hypothetical protein